MLLKKNLLENISERNEKDTKRGFTENRHIVRIALLRPLIYTVLAGAVFFSIWPVGNSRSAATFKMFPPSKYGGTSKFRQEIPIPSNFRQILVPVNFRQKGARPSIFRHHRNTVLAEEFVTSFQKIFFFHFHHTEENNGREIKRKEPQGLS